MQGTTQVSDESSLRQVLIVTGLSGAGKSVALRSLEDLGFYCVDNLPIPLVSTFLDFSVKSRAPKVALGIDARGGVFLNNLMTELNKIRSGYQGNAQVRIVFLNAQDETIMKRFQETRRAHPLAKDISVSQAIKSERELLAPIKELADEVHHTDKSNIHELRRWVHETFAGGCTQELVVNVISFGFKYGLPIESNLVYDLRFLPNPFFVPELKKLTGKDLSVQKYLFEQDVVNVYWDKLQDFLRYLLSCYHEEGRFFANVSIGCTGGKHRSVAFVERLCQNKWDNIKFLAYHRDLGRE
jgi:UPF0042 nucleotide-binding protein